MSTIESVRAMPAAEAPERVSTILGDRICITCGFNLYGQPVVREPIYKLLIVRCPECGAAAALQEYPALGRWASRWAAVLAAIWLLFLFGLIAATGGMIAGFAHGSGQGSAMKLASELAIEHEAWLNSEDGAAVKNRIQGWNMPLTGPNSWLMEEWIQADRHHAVFEATGSVHDVFDWSGASETWLWTAVLCLLLGIIWSVVLLMRPRWQVLLAMVLPLGAAVLFAAASRNQADPMMWSGMRVAWSVAASMLWPWTLIYTLIPAIIGLTVGIAVGRSVARFFVGILLPPRMASSLAILWIAEGKPPPRPVVR